MSILQFLPQSIKFWQSKTKFIYKNYGNTFFSEINLIKFQIPSTN